MERGLLQYEDLKEFKFEEWVQPTTKVLEELK